MTLSPSLRRWPFQLITPVPDSAPPPKPSLWNTPPDSSPSPTFVLLPPLHGISIGSPGEITRGRVQVKLSRAQDPYYSSRSLVDLIATADAQGQDEEDLEDEEEDTSWRWEGEDNLTLGHVWDIRSRDPKRGIIYHHDDKTSMHITLNTQTVPHRKGVGNMPFVFHAYGTAHLDPPRLPPSMPAPGAGSTSTPSLPPRRMFSTYRRRVPSPLIILDLANAKPIVQTSFRSFPPAYPLLHINTYSSAVTKAVRPEDVDPVLLVTLPDKPTACCHLQHRSLTFLCPISGDLHQDNHSLHSGTNGQTHISRCDSVPRDGDLQAHLRKAVQVDEDGHGDKDKDKDKPCGGNNDKDKPHGGNNDKDKPHGGNNDKDKPCGGDNNNNNHCGGGIDNDHCGGGGSGGGDKGGGNGDDVM
ncbi:hypothetical protein EDB84DRAFT_1629148 [Lactarius hengduanensis]|nr:hypothetical protein EDB84DRAFT_1629148 [Lactarius hengduanensis]